MEIFLAVIELVFIFKFAETSINDGLPDWIPRDKWGVDYTYRFIKILAVWLLFMWGYPSLIWVWLFWIAYWIKKVFRKNRYWDYLD